ncbi:MAG TPA: hypothetical protein VN453_02710, partial [Feifaniaceae bacterium]|nr:hypothetical protein [Feifaniaceae bacterium]
SITARLGNFSLLWPCGKRLCPSLSDQRGEFCFIERPFPNPGVQTNIASRPSARQSRKGYQTL